ncbi:hypothetical protein [Pseudonocardia sp. ICBG1293]|uniref:hypothetical protein n=1 Tax=Pseudonocardia sp. ICBG1293 TaxID=2844382 RepID=UPI001CC9EBC2|nr:hypothetical protein [Pseudonocardia sp. ICBG1293]
MSGLDAATDRKQKVLATGVGCGGLLFVFLIVLMLAISCSHGGRSTPSSTVVAPPPMSASAAPAAEPVQDSYVSATVPAPAVGGKECSGFATQTQAQAELLPGDPYGLDQDGDGQACEVYFASKDTN